MEQGPIRLLCEDVDCLLTLDRTNWYWGKSKINVFMLGIAYEGLAIPSPRTHDIYQMTVWILGQKVYCILNPFKKLEHFMQCLIPFQLPQVPFHSSL